MTTTVRAGGWDLGVRAGSADVDAVVRGVLGDRCRDDLEPPANYSISATATSPDGPAAALPALYGGHTALLRSRSLPLLVAGLLANLASRELAERSGLMWLDACVLVTADGRAIVAAGGHRRNVVEQRRSLGRLGLRYHPVPQVAVDIDSGEVIVPELAEATGEARALAADEDVAGTLVPPGRYLVAGWALAGSDGLTSLSGAHAVMRTFSLVKNLDELGSQQVLDGLGRVVAGTSTLVVPRRPDDVVAGLGQLATAS